MMIWPRPLRINRPYAANARSLRINRPYAAMMIWPIDPCVLNGSVRAGPGRVREGRYKSSVTVHVRSWTLSVNNSITSSAVEPFRLPRVPTSLLEAVLFWELARPCHSWHHMATGKGARAGRGSSEDALHTNIGLRHNSPSLKGSAWR